MKDDTEPIILPTRKDRPIKEYRWLSGLLFCVLLAGFAVIWVRKNPYIFLFAISAFSIAYAIHFFSISIGIVGIFVRMEEKDRSKIEDLRSVEYEIVSCGLRVLGGGLGILLSGGISLLVGECFLSKFLTSIVYIPAAYILASNVSKYQLSIKPEGLRGWPWKILEILWQKKSA